MTDVREPAPVPVWPSVEEFCGDLAVRAEGRVEEWAEAMLDAIRAKVSAYAELSGDELDAVRTGLGAAKRLFLATLRDVRLFTDDEVALLEAVGEQRSAQGVPFAALVEAMGVAHEVGYDRVHAMAAARAGEVPGVVDLDAVPRHLSLHAQRFLHGLVEAFRAGYARAGHRRVEPRERQLFEALLVGGLSDEAEIRRVSRHAGMALRAPCALLVLAPVAGGDHDVVRGTAILRPALADAAVGPVLPDPCPHVVAVVSLTDRCWDELLAELATAVPAAGLIVVAEYAPELAAIHGIYQVLRRRLAVVPRLRRPAVRRPMHLTPLWLANVCDTDDRFLEVDRVLGATLGRRCDWAAADLEVLRALRETCGEAQPAARALGLSLNGMRRRLREISKRTGLRFKNADDMAMLAHALSLYWCDPDSLPPLGDPRWGRAPGVRRPYLGPTLGPWM